MPRGYRRDLLWAQIVRCHPLARTALGTRKIPKGPVLDRSLFCQRSSDSILAKGLKPGHAFVQHPFCQSCRVDSDD